MIQPYRAPSLRLRRLAVCAVAALTAVLMIAVPASAGPTTDAPQAFLGEAILPTGLQFDGTEVGGLSGISYDAGRDVYYAISDDRSQIDPARFYTLRIDLSDGSLDDGDVTVLAVTTLLDESEQPFPPGSLDPESLVLTPDDTVVITSEGDAVTLIDPFVREFTLDGRQVSNLPVPKYYDPTATRGIRNNLAFESAGITRSGDYLFTGTENALLQDGPAATLTTSSPSRILRYNKVGMLDQELVYVVEPVQVPPIPADGFAVNGLVDLLALSPTRLIAMERNFSSGVGNDARLYLVDTAGATNVRGLRALPPGLSFVQPASKTLLFDLDRLGITLDNLEGVSFGPVLPDGSQSLVIVSDNNFSPTQVTQFLAFTV